MAASPGTPFFPLSQPCPLTAYVRLFCRVARLEALGFVSSPRQLSWQRRLAALDVLIAALGFPAAYALLVLAASCTHAAAMAAQAVASCRDRREGVAATSGGGGGGFGGTGGEQLSGLEAAAVVRWYRCLHPGKLPPDAVRALEARGLAPGA